MTSEADCVLALQILTTPLTSPAAEGLHPDERAAVKKAGGWISGPNVVGTGASLKLVRGSLSADFSLRVYVKRKLTHSVLEKRHVVPDEVVLPGIKEPIRTDVVAIGPIAIQLVVDSSGALTSRVRPVTPGYSIGLMGGETGTLGCIVAKLSAPTRPLLLSCSHDWHKPDSQRREQQFFSQVRVMVARSETRSERCLNQYRLTLQLALTTFVTQPWLSSQLRLLPTRFLRLVFQRYPSQRRHCQLASKSKKRGELLAIRSGLFRISIFRQLCSTRSRPAGRVMLDFESRFCAVSTVIVETRGPWSVI